MISYSSWPPPIVLSCPFSQTIIQVPEFLGAEPDVLSIIILTTLLYFSRYSFYKFKSKLNSIHLQFAFVFQKELFLGWLVCRAMRVGPDCPQMRWHHLVPLVLKYLTLKEVLQLLYFCI